MSDILILAQRSALMAKERGSGNASTELRLVAAFRALGITGWRRGNSSHVPKHESAPRFRYVRKNTAARSGTRNSFRVGAEAFPGPHRLRFPKPPPSPRLRWPGKLAVFVDGCFWHGCPLHATWPKQNAEFWREKIAKNQARDLLVTRQLRARGWRVLRLWEHELTRKYEKRLLARLRRVGLVGVSEG